MTATLSATARIEKEEIGRCAFQKTNRRLPEFELRERNRKLYLAMLLGNNFQSRVKIVFETLDGAREVISTVWATTEKYVILKGGHFVPMDSIATVELD